MLSTNDYGFFLKIKHCKLYYKKKNKTHLKTSKWTSQQLRSNDFGDSVSAFEPVPIGDKLFRRTIQCALSGDAAWCHGTQSLVNNSKH